MPINSASDFGFDYSGQLPGPSQERAAPGRSAFLLSIYTRDGLSYGGAEEGGWWYETETLVRTVKVFRDEDSAYAAARRFNAWLDRLQKHLPPLSSMIYSGGRYVFAVHEDKAPAHLPETRPHYE